MFKFLLLIKNFFRSKKEYSKLPKQKEQKDIDASCAASKTIEDFFKKRF